MGPRLIGCFSSRTFSAGFQAGNRVVTQFQQQGEVMDFLVPAGHWSKHSDFGGWLAEEFH